MNNLQLEEELAELTELFRVALVNGATPTRAKQLVEAWYQGRIHTLELERMNP